jgi:hypothetical protein
MLGYSQFSCFAYLSETNLIKNLTNVHKLTRFDTSHCCHSRN